MLYFSTLFSICKILRKTGIKKLIFVIISAILVSVFDLVIISAILPLVTLFFSSNSNLNNDVMGKLIDFLDLDFSILSLNKILMIFLIFLIIASIMRLILLRHINFFIEKQRSNISSRLYENYLSQEYIFHSSRNSSDLMKNVISEVDLFSQNTLKPIVSMLSHIIIFAFIFLALIYTNVIITIVVVLILLFYYTLFYLISSSRMSTLGAEALKINKERYFLVDESFAGIKSIKLSNMESVFIGAYRKAVYRYGKMFATKVTREQIPGVFFESIMIGIIIVSLSVFEFLGDIDHQRIIATIIAIAYGLSRLKSSAQNINTGLLALKFNKPMIDNLVLELGRGFRQNISVENVKFDTPESLIKLNKIQFSYGDNNKHQLGPIDLEIPIGSFCCVVGETGSGKTTLVDILSGLIIPDTGHLLADKKIVHENKLTSWRELLFYTTQDVFLVDGTIEENIALGSTNAAIDSEKIVESARLACVHDFIVENLSDGYATQVGQRGSRLSGGQRQRIGIARAIYSGKPILIFDECTSSLDLSTESIIIDAMCELCPERTIIFITHRDYALNKCDFVIKMKSGQIDSISEK